MSFPALAATELGRGISAARLGVGTTSSAGVDHATGEIRNRRRANDAIARMVPAVAIAMYSRITWPSNDFHRPLVPAEDLTGAVPMHPMKMSYLERFVVGRGCLMRLRSSRVHRRYFSPVPTLRLFDRAWRRRFLPSDRAGPARSALRSAVTVMN